MTLTRRYVLTAIPLFSEAVAFICIFVLFSATPDATAARFSLPVYLICLLACTLLNALLARREHSLFFLIFCNALSTALVITFVFLTPHTLSGISMHLYIGFLCLYLAPRSAALIRNPITADKMLKYCEVSAFSTAFMLLFQVIAPRPDIVLLCFAATGLNFAALSSFRILRARQTGIAGSGIQRGFVLGVAGIGAFLVALFLGALLLPALREAIVATILAIWGAILAIGRFVLWLFSLLLRLFPEDIYEMPPIDAPEIVLPPEHGLAGFAELPMFFFYALLALLVTGGIVAIFFVLRKLRGLRLRGIAPVSAVKRKKSRTPSLFSLLLALLKRLYGRLKFSLRLLRQFDTVAGVFVRIERRSRRCGAPRRPSEPPREFLMRIFAGTPTDDVETRPAFLSLADKIDRMCFSSGSAPNVRMDRAQRRVLLRAIKPRWSKRRK